MEINRITIMQAARYLIALSVILLSACGGGGGGGGGVSANSSIADVLFA